MRRCVPAFAVVAVALSAGVIEPAWSGSEDPAAQTPLTLAVANDTTGLDPAVDNTGNEFLSQSRAGLHSLTEGVARWVDGWFGDKPFEEGGKVSGRIGLHLLKREDESLDTNVRFNARLDLPNLKEKGYLFFGQDNERELVTDRPEAFSRQQQLLTERRGEDTFFAGLGYALREYFEFRAGVRGGLNLYTQARFRKKWWLGERDDIDFRETLFWTVKSGFGSTTAVEYEHAYSSSLSFRWRTAGTFSEDTSGLGWSSSAGMFKAFGEQRLLSLEALANGETGSRVDVAEYGVRAIWKQAIYRDWVLGELIVGHFWPQKEDDPERRRSWAMGFGVELLF